MLTFVIRKKPSLYGSRRRLLSQKFINMVEQIYNILLEYKTSGNIYGYKVYFTFKHDRLNLKKIDLNSINASTIKVMMLICSTMRKSHYNDDASQWIDKSMLVDLNHTTFGMEYGITRSLLYKCLDELVLHKFIFKLNKTIYLVNPYIYNVLNMEQSSHLINTLRSRNP